MKLIYRLRLWSMYGILAAVLVFGAFFIALMFSFGYSLSALIFVGLVAFLVYVCVQLIRADSRDLSEAKMRDR